MIKAHRQESYFALSMAACLAFVLLTCLAMVIFPGGTSQNHSETHYLFFRNPFSDLGRTHTFNGHSNTLCMLVFVSAMVSGAVGLGVFFVAFAGALRATRT